MMQRVTRKPSSLKTWTLYVLLILLVLGGAPLFAQDDGGGGGDTAEKSEELKKLEEQNAILEQQILLKENQRKLIEAQFPQEVEPLEGKVETEGDVPIEVKILAHRALGPIADQIVQAIGDKGSGKPLVIYDEGEINSLVHYQAFSVQLDLLTREYERLLGAYTGLTGDEKARKAALDELEKAQKATTAFFPTLVGGALRSVIDVLSLFRTDVKVTSKDLTLDELALITAVSSRLERGIYHPAVFSPNLLSGDSEMMGKLSLLDGYRTRVDAALVVLKKEKAVLEAAIAKDAAAIKEKTDEINKKKKEIEKATGAKKAKLEKEKEALEKQKSELEEGKSAKQGKVTQLSQAIENLTTINTLYATFQAALLATDESSGLNALTRLLRAEKLQTLMNGDGNGNKAYTLLLEIVAAGGSTKTSQNLFTGGKLRHSGGVVVSFVLFDSGGKMVASGSFDEHSGQRKFKSWGRSKNGN